MDRYAVVGNPVAHSKSPQIHAAFAAATGQKITYERLLAPIGGFADVAETFAREGGKGLNITVPFKLDALAVAQTASERARAAGACNTLKRDGDGWYADNTDGAGIVRDLTANLDVSVEGRDVLVLGAGGAARGILLPMFAQQPRSLVLSNRTSEKADRLARQFASRGPISSVEPNRISGYTFDVVINATSAGLKGDASWLWPDGLFRTGAFAYDMTYADGSTPFIRWARDQGVTRTADGIGMLIEQAAESFFLWRGVRPHTAPVFKLLRPSN
jgi:shikimate dehydrogenase